MARQRHTHKEPVSPHVANALRITGKQRPLNQEGDKTGTSSQQQQQTHRQPEDYLQYEEQEQRREAASGRPGSSTDEVGVDNKALSQEVAMEEVEEETSGREEGENGRTPRGLKLAGHSNPGRQRAARAHAHTVPFVV